jgi:GNAT superfamily N-acetyltransferase
MNEPVTIRLAVVNDVRRISALLYANAPENGGALLAGIPEDGVAAWIATGDPVFVAESDGMLAGVAFTSERSRMRAPYVLAMFAAWPGSSDAYSWGPVCVAETARGRGVLGLLRAEAVRRLGAREAICFIRADNTASLRAHHKLGMEEVARYEFARTAYLVYSSRPERSEPAA